MTSQRGEQPDTAPRPGIVLPTQRQPFPRYHVHQFVSIRPLAFPNHQLYNLLPFDTRPRNGGTVQPTPRGDMIRRSEEVQRAIKLTKKTQKIHEGKTKQKIYEGERKGKKKKNKQQQKQTTINNKANDKASSIPQN